MAKKHSSRQPRRTGRTRSTQANLPEQRTRPAGPTADNVVPLTRQRECEPPRRVLRASKPEDLLALVPCLLGFHPQDSVVVITLGDAPAPFHARMDLPSDADECAAVVDEVVRLSTRFALDRVVLVLYSDDPVLSEAVSGPLVDRLHDRGVTVPAALRADGARWFCLMRGWDGCDGDCPAEGAPYDLSSHPFIAEAVLEGQVILDSRDALRDSLAPADLDEVQRVGRAAEAAADRIVAAWRSPLGPPDPAGARAYLVKEGLWLQARIRRFVREGLRFETTEVGRLLAAITSIEVRDVAWAEMRRSDAARHVDLWRDVVRRSPQSTVGPPAALLAFAAWLAGNGALAWCAVDRCQEAAPGYSMAGLVSQALAGAVPPSTWEPLGPEALTLFAD